MARENTRIKQILASGQPGSSVEVCGWVRSKRESKGFAFVVLNDGSTQDNLQLVVNEGSAAFAQLARCVTGAAVKANGTVQKSLGKGQDVELITADMTVYGEADPEKYPLQKKGHTLEFLREISHLRPRTNTFGAVFRLRNTLAHGIHEFFQKRGFMWVHTPILTASDCEGGGALFQVTTLDMDNPPKLKQAGKESVDFNQDFFGTRANLTVSGQLEAEAFALAVMDTYTFGPTFRAENSNTTRHLSEFWMVEPEIAFAGLPEIMQLAEDFLRDLCRLAVDRCGKELAFLEHHYKGMTVSDIAKLAESSFHRMTYTDAVSELRKAKVKFDFPVEWGIDLQSEHERYLTDQVFKGPVIVTDYPQGIKAFYMRLNEDGKTVAAMDMLAPKVGEIIGGSQREERLDHLEARMAAMHIPTDRLQWYLDLRRFGSTPHAGFGLGFERLVQYLTGMGNIRDTIPFPRAPRLIDF